MAANEEVIDVGGLAERITRLEVALSKSESARLTLMSDIEAIVCALSHDLRAPVRSVLGFTKALEEVCGPTLTGEARDYLALAGSGARQLSLMVEALVEWLRVQPVSDAGVVDMRGVIESAILVLERRGMRCRERMRVADLPACRGSASELVQLWTRLIENAVAASEGRDAASIDVTSLPSPVTRGRMLGYRIADQGIGFDPGAARDLFRPFRTLHPRSGRGRFPGSGVGMGLAIAQRIARAHGGQIEATSAGPGLGATFLVTLPNPDDAGGVPASPRVP